MSIWVRFEDHGTFEIPLEDLLAVCRISDYAIPLPVASRRVFDSLKKYVEKHEPQAVTTEERLDLLEWDEAFMEEFSDTELNQLKVVARLAKASELVKLCTMKIQEILHADNGGEDDEEEEDDEDESWKELAREENELYGEERESPFRGSPSP